MPNPTTPPNQSGGINLGDLTSGRDTNVNLTDVAGRDKAAIINSPGATIIQSGQRPPLFFGVPTMPNQFVGRDALMSELIHQLTNGHSLALSAEGLPGVGKTTLAVALAHHRAILTHFRDGLLWANLGRVPDVLSTLGLWAEALGGDVTHLPTQRQRQQAVHDLIGQKRLLLIIDDAWELESAQHLRCGGPYCVHLLTTRDKGLARGFAGNQHLTAVPPLDDDPASQLLRTLAPAAWNTDPSAAHRLAQAVGGLPLALELLGGYLADPQAPERSYFPTATQAALTHLTVPAQRLQLATQRLGSHDGPISLQATIELSLADLPQPTRDAFSALGAFAPKPATFSQDAALAVTAATPRDLSLLIERNLLAWDGQQGTLHQTLADVAVSHLPPTATARHWDYYLAQANADRHAWQTIQPLYEQIQWAWQHAPDIPDTLELIWALRLYQERRGLWADYLAGADRGLTLCQAHGLRRYESVLLVHLGFAYDALGQRQTALDYYQQALPILEEVGDRAILATTLNNIGVVYNALGQRKTALDYYNRALPIQEEVGDRAGQATTLSNIGLVYANLGQQQTALDYFQRALPIQEEVGDRAGQATTLNNIGAVYDNLGQRQTALDYYQQALPIRAEVGDRYGEATTLNNIGMVYHALGQPQTALDYYQQALPIQEEVSDRAGQATTLNNIGMVYRHLGNNQTALDYYQQALPILEEVGDRYGEAITRYNITLIHRAQGQLPQAIAQLRQVVELDRLVQSPNLEEDSAILSQLEAQLTPQQS